MHHRRTRRAMYLSRGLILGRVWQGIRSFVIGLCALTLTTLTVTGHAVFAIVSLVTITLLAKLVIRMLKRRYACR